MHSSSAATLRSPISDASPARPGAARSPCLPFVSQPSHAPRQADAVRTLATLEAKYGFSGPYFFLPNQFWQHKNHAVVFKAVNRLKERGLDVLLICTGNLRDYRSDRHRLLRRTTRVCRRQRPREPHPDPGHDRLWRRPLSSCAIAWRCSIHRDSRAGVRRWRRHAASASRSSCPTSPCIGSRIRKARCFSSPDDEQHLANLMAAVWTAPPHMVDKWKKNVQPATLRIELLLSRPSTNNLVMSLQEGN